MTLNRAGFRTLDNLRKTRKHEAEKRESKENPDQVIKLMNGLEALARQFDDVKRQESKSKQVIMSDATKREFQ